jgi:hypothetical protein
MRLCSLFGHLRYSILEQLHCVIGMAAIAVAAHRGAAGLPARVQIPVPQSATSRLLYELLGRVRLGFLVVSPFRIAREFLHVQRGRSSKRVWRSPRIIYY